MYINFHKFNYDLVDIRDRVAHEQRDKEAYKEVLRQWFESNIEDSVNRKWEVEEIHYLKKISDFIKLIREAESIYELGFFTSCIALVGISAEDFSKYVSLENGRPTHITDTYTSGARAGQQFDVSQYNRLKLQLNEGLINQQTYDLLDEIRKIRNDCLHYNQSFKQKADTDLRADAIKSLNNLKSVLKSNIGTSLNPADFMQLFEELMKNGNTRSFQEVIWKQKNMFSHLFNFSTVQGPGINKVTKINFFKVTDLDDEEIELTEIEENIEMGVNLVVWVDIDKKGKNLINNNSIEVDDIVLAEVYSNVAKDGQTQLWYLNRIDKIATEKS